MTNRAGPPRVPLHRSLVTRLLATSILIAVAAIVATAWLAIQSTTRAIQQEQGRSLADDKSIYDTLVGYGATHPDWSGVDAVVAERAAELDRRITLTTVDRQTIADSAAGPPLLTARPSATVDPLHLDPGLTGAAGPIDVRAAGPFRLTAGDRERLREIVGEQLRCLRNYGVDGEIVDGPSGRPTIRLRTVDPKNATFSCQQKMLSPTGPQLEALAELEGTTASCLGLPPDGLEIDLDFSVRLRASNIAGAIANRIGPCLEKARQAQLQRYVAAPALLFVTDPRSGTAQPVFNLSRASVLRIAWTTAMVLVAAVVVTILAGRRLVRPLRALTEAAGRPVDHYTRVPVSMNDEIGHLALALNDLAERREQSESQRRAMVHDVAHELRTPLTNIRSWLESAQDGLSPTGPLLLELLHEEALLLQHIIDDLGDLAAADAGNLRVHPEPVFVRDILAHVADAHHSAAAAAGVRLRTQVEGDPEATVDQVRLRQLIGNLVANGIRYTPAGGTVTVTAAVTGGELIVAVQDTGIGISAENLPRIFDRFWRADSSRARATGGSGLGLAIARKLAEAHGGTLMCASRPGAGTTFTLRVPASEVSA